MPWTAASTNRVVRKKARTGKEQLRRSRVPEKTSNSRGVMTRKLSRLTRTISTSGRRRKSPSRWRAVATPPKPPPRIRMRFFDAEAFTASPRNCPNQAIPSEAPPPPITLRGGRGHLPNSGMSRSLRRTAVGDGCPGDLGHDGVHQAVGGDEL